jgi:putative aldouronate transport system permease protein
VPNLKTIVQQAKQAKHAKHDEAQQVLPRIKKNRFHRSQARDLTLLALPAILLLILFNYVPMAGVILAFKNYRIDDGIWGSAFNGFSNFKFFFLSQDAWRVTRNTVGLNFIFIVTVMIGAMAFAILLSELTAKFSVKVYQTTMFFPYFLSMPVVAYVVLAFLNVDLGMVNHVLARFGVEPIAWYGKAELWPFILTIVNFWKSIGYNTLIFYAALMAFDRSYYEAAEVDGATQMQMRLKITLPLLTPLVIIMTIIQLGHIFYSDFGLFYMVTQDIGTLYATTDVIDTYVFRSLRVVGDIGMASAANLYQATVGFILVLTVNTIVRKFNSENALF